MSPDTNERGSWERIEAELRQRPRVPADAVDRVMARVANTRMEPPVAPRASHGHWLTRRRIVAISPLQLMAAGLLLAVGIGAYVGVRREATVPNVLTASGSSSRTVLPTSNDGTRRVQFVFHAVGAKSVSVAGDFNDWDPRSTPLRPSGTAGVWSVEVPLQPGRHLYSFVVDGRLWVPDAEAPRAPENEFGSERSVVLVESKS